MNGFSIVSFRKGGHFTGFNVQPYTGTKTIAELKKAMLRQSCGDELGVYIKTDDGRFYGIMSLDQQFAIDYWGGEA